MKLFLDENIPQEDAGKLLLKFPGSIYAREDKRFPPEPTGGIIVLRTKGMRPQDLRGSLTIITKTKIRTRTWRN